MAYQPNPNDPYRAGVSDEEIRRQAHLNNLDNELQADPVLREESSPSGAKVAMFAVAIAVVLPAAPPGMRDVTPKANTEPGTTTGAATKTTPPSSNPTGTEIDRAKQ
jgi:hypothetical protein